MGTVKAGLGTVKAGLGTVKAGLGTQVGQQDVEQMRMLGQEVRYNHKTLHNCVATC